MREIGDERFEGGADFRDTVVGFFVFGELVVEEEREFVGFDAVFHVFYRIGVVGFGFGVFGGRVPDFGVEAHVHHGLFIGVNDSCVYGIFVIQIQRVGFLPLDPCFPHVQL